MKENYEKLMAEGKTAEEAITRLDEIMKILRVECPWDREQTHESIRTCLLEEAYEVVDAINRKDDANLREELGDVLLQVVFHSSLAREKGRFDLKHGCRNLKATTKQRLAARPLADTSDAL